MHRGSSIATGLTAYVSVRQRTSAYVSVRQHTSSHVSIRQHTSSYVSIRQHTSAYVIWQTVPTGGPSVYIVRSELCLALKGLSAQQSSKIGTVSVVKKVVYQ
jgi:hypothetical protein